MLCLRICVSTPNACSMISHSPRIFLLWFNPLLLLPLVFLLSSFSANILSSIDITSFSTGLAIWGFNFINKFTTFGTHWVPKSHHLATHLADRFWRILEKCVRLILLWKIHYWYVFVWQFHHWLNPKTCSLMKKCWSRTIENLSSQWPVNHPWETTSQTKPSSKVGKTRVEWRVTIII